MLKGEAKLACLDSKGVLTIGGCICVPRVGGWVCMILEKVHCLTYSIHLGGN